MTSEIKEVARYLKIPFDIPLATSHTIEEMLFVAKQLTPQKRVAYFDITKSDKGIVLVGTNIVLGGKLASKHFHNCTQIIAVLATMGMKSELLLQKYFAENSEKAVVLDACLTTLVEKFLDATEEELKTNIMARMPASSITTRISCGYGDLELSHQKELLSVLRGNIIGVFMNDSYMLTPNKSVIALIGVKNEVN